LQREDASRKFQVLAANEKPHTAEHEGHRPPCRDDVLTAEEGRDALRFQERAGDMGISSARVDLNNAEGDVMYR
jgi:hypothetical protein